MVLQVEDANGCAYMATLTINEHPTPELNVSSDVTICEGEEIELTATGDGIVSWSNGETTNSIWVSPITTTPYTVVLTDENGCQAEETILVTVDQKITLGDFVFSDENENGIQDTGESGVDGVTVQIFQCSDKGATDGVLVDITVTSTNPVTGEPGYYNFEICPNSGSYYIQFSDVPEGFEFTTANTGANDSMDSDANTAGVTDCFEVEATSNHTLDAGIKVSCPMVLQYKVRPRDPDGTYITGNSSTACLGYDLILRVVRPGEETNPDVDNDYTGWTFTFVNANGGTSVRSDAQAPYQNSVSRYGLNADDFGIYTISWVNPDGCEGSAEFLLELEPNCTSTPKVGGIPMSITKVFPVPAVSGDKVTLVLNTDTGSINTNTDLNAVSLQAVFPSELETVTVSLFDTSSRMVNDVKTYEVSRGRDVIDYPLDYLSAGTYILKVDGDDWSDSKQIIIK
ncbi:Hypothetical protein I595_2003 [Croceitalea dokdonensis DOKDO 023]|uniref:SD-repeat containing protein B domain-containing protein n=1 Tax=Croceitalea dokdonensis DOKDO 023 TaxID=1300341 RepID=A0A0P7B2C1_9FLAO|nr:Hypothetical protein I595_2003 [Croceitalea dokdonensis DOKDO 023]